jgi:hypothetical protein
MFPASDMQYFLSLYPAHKGVNFFGHVGFSGFCFAGR